MSFAAGIGAGMGAGIAIGMGSGQKRAIGKIREYLVTHEMTIHDRMGKEVPLETVLEEARAGGQCTNKGWTFAFLAVLAGLALLGVIGYFVLL